MDDIHLDATISTPDEIGNILAQLRPSCAGNLSPETLGDVVIVADDLLRTALADHPHVVRFVARGTPEHLELSVLVCGAAPALTDCGTGADLVRALEIVVARAGSWSVLHTDVGPELSLRFRLQPAAPVPGTDVPPPA